LNLKHSLTIITDINHSSLQTYSANFKSFNNSAHGLAILKVDAYKTCLSGGDVVVANYPWRFDKESVKNYLSLVLNYSSSAQLSILFTHERLKTPIVSLLTDKFGQDIDLVLKPQDFSTNRNKQKYVPVEKGYFIAFNKRPTVQNFNS
jgi:hypothetical protein